MGLGRKKLEILKLREKIWRLGRIAVEVCLRDLYMSKGERIRLKFKRVIRISFFLNVFFSEIKELLNSLCFLLGEEVYF